MLAFRPGREFTNVVYVLLLVALLWNLSIQNDEESILSFESESGTFFSGEDVRLRCLFNLSGKVDFNFNRSKILVFNSTLMASSSKYHYSFTNQSGKVEHVLEIKDVGKSEEGDYFCTQGHALTKRTFLNVTFVPEGRPKCTKFPAQSSFDHTADKPGFRFNCSTNIGDLQVNISLFVNGTLVEVNVVEPNKTVGNYSEGTLSFLSNVTDVSENTFCRVTHGMQLTTFNRSQVCYYVPVIISSTVRKSTEMLLTTTYQSPNASKISETRLIVLVIGFLVSMLLLSVIGLKLIQRLGDRNEMSSNQTLDDYVTVPMQDVSVEHHQRNRDITTNNASLIPQYNRQSLAEFSMTKNDMYESCNGELLNYITGTMVKNEIYESVTDSGTTALEIYSTIQRR